MLLTTYAHQLDIENTAPSVCAALGELSEVLEAMPYLYWPDKSEKLLSADELSVDKERQLRKQESLQSLYNVWLRQELVERGFDREFLVRDTSRKSDLQKVDFAKLLETGKHIFVEVEFGYTASIERNLFKMLDAYHHGRSELGVLVCPMASLAKATASGVASYETARERLQSFHPNTYPAPLVLIGLNKGAARIDLSKSLLPGPTCLSGNNNKEVLWHVASELRAGVCVDTIGLPGALELKQATRALKLRNTTSELQVRLAF